jgi:hypothetical protein
MGDSSIPANFIIPEDTELFRTLRRVVESARIVMFAGLPGVGKSLLIQQLAILANASGRRINLLQWDVARAAFETDAILAGYPEVDGITHSVIRKAAGLWARDAVLRWHREYRDDSSLLVGETPLVGNRLIELAGPVEDECEALLCDERTRFVIPVPSREVREVIEGARLLSSERPRHERELADAMPNVMRALWLELREVASIMGIVKADQQAESEEYDPNIYGKVYASVLRHRYHEVVRIDKPIDTGNRSVYEVDVPYGELVASEDEAMAFVGEVERRYPDLQMLEQETSAWYAI